MPSDNDTLPELMFAQIDVAILDQYVTYVSWYRNKTHVEYIV